MALSFEESKQQLIQQKETVAKPMMMAADKTKLDGIATGANKTIVDSGLSSSSTNPVQNKAISSALGKKLNLSGGTMTGALTTKGIKLTSGTDYGTTLPSSPATNQLFFQTVGSNFVLDNVYPVGSIYMNVNSTNPGTLFGGTWEQIQGRFLLGMSSSYPAGSQGGEAEHTLTEAEMPSHDHGIKSGLMLLYTNNSKAIKETPVANGVHNVTGYDGFFAQGGGAAHNNMPPYLSVYIWKRTA